jgi:hypothetical protein
MKRSGLKSEELDSELTLLSLPFNLFESGRIGAFHEFDAEIALYDLYRFKVVKGLGGFNVQQWPIVLDHGGFSASQYPRYR